MKVRVHYHAQLRQRVGMREEEVCLNDGATVRELLRVLRARHASLEGLFRGVEAEQGQAGWLGLLIFVDDRQATAEEVLRGSSEVILMTPIAGGGR